jgi:hypothetical protein
MQTLKLSMGVAAAIIGIIAWLMVGVRIFIFIMDAFMPTFVWKGELYQDKTWDFVGGLLIGWAYLTLSIFVAEKLEAMDKAAKAKRKAAQGMDKKVDTY